MQPEQMKIDKEMSPLEYHMFKKLGLSKEDMDIIHDLARHAAEKAAQSAFIVAMTAPRAEMVNLISITAALMLGQSGIKVANQSAEKLAEFIVGRMTDGQGLREYDGSFQA